MRVEVNLTRKDLWKFNHQIMFKSKWTWGICGVAWLFVVIDTMRRHIDESFPMPYLFIGLFSLLIAILILVIFLVFFECLLLIGFLTIYKHVGVLGHHEYIITEDGIREITEANDSLTKWTGIRKIFLKENHILVSLGYLYHIIPKRSFHSESEYNEFYNMLVSQWKTHT